MSVRMWEGVRVRRLSAHGRSVCSSTCITVARTFIHCQRTSARTHATTRDTQLPLRALGSTRLALRIATRPEPAVIIGCACACAFSNLQAKDRALRRVLQARALSAYI
mmetsp:Transcript_14702/g.31470  ORF Transcript_14702/g.31470 Transcript_14702/m.31470 type:complete len:108 (-) Transcript_14702:346-669(-)